eukprot:GHVT01081398.1.p1 GENE.GHVT01081398.1~~GHVT01081398.1.p1  ORF type:complete len:150 (+),score=32.90 GHVT01081398.1:1480-1929(+)
MMVSAKISCSCFGCLQIFNVVQRRVLWVNRYYRLCLFEFFDQQWVAICLASPARSSAAGGGPHTEKANRNFVFLNSSIRHDTTKAEEDESAVIVICHTLTNEKWACAKLNLDLALDIEGTSLYDAPDLLNRMPWMDMKLADPSKVFPTT